MARIGRRRLLEAGIAAIGGVVSLLSGGVLLGFFGGVLGKRETPQWARLCALGDLDAIEPRHFRIAFRARRREEFEDVRGVYGLLTEDGPLVFSNVCTHMHCSVRWVAWRQQITCPCHGGFYDRRGKLIGGPPPFDLPVYRAEVRGGDVWIANDYVRKDTVR